MPSIQNTYTRTQLSVWWKTKLISSHNAWNVGSWSRQWVRVHFVALCLWTLIHYVFLNLSITTSINIFSYFSYISLSVGSNDTSQSFVSKCISGLWPPMTLCSFAGTLLINTVKCGQKTCLDNFSFGDHLTQSSIKNWSLSNSLQSLECQFVLYTSKTRSSTGCKMKHDLSNISTFFHWFFCSALILKCPLLALWGLGRNHDGHAGRSATAQAHNCVL